MGAEVKSLDHSKCPECGSTNYQMRVDAHLRYGISGLDENGVPVISSVQTYPNDWEKAELECESCSHCWYSDWRTH